MEIGAAHMKILILLFCSSVVLSSQSETWPQPHRKYSVRPKSDPFCNAGVQAFCPTGLKSNFMPTFGANDTLVVYAMKAPVWEFLFGSLLGKYHIMHDAIGFHHVQSGLNLTMEWYELFELFNCTFPHEVQKNKLLWCNQGATCAYAGIDKKHWQENGTLVKVSEITGDQFNKFAEWTELDNSSYPYYETWTVRQSKGGPYWFNPFDCASWVLRAFDKMKEFGATFDQSVHLNYTKINLYSKQPEQLGNYSEIFETPGNEKLRDNIVKFYSNFQKEKHIYEYLEHMLEYMVEFLIDDAFYLFYNDVYWKLPLSYPYMGLTYDEVPLP